VQIAAVSEDQTKNAWTPLLEMIREGPIMDSCYGLEPLDTFVNLPKGRIEFVTASAASREGNRPVFAVLDQTESWTPGNGGVRLAATLRRNLGKTDGSSIEAPNAYQPGAQSVAEASAEAAKQDRSIFYWHREAPKVEDFHDRPKVLAALEDVYGDSGKPRGGWVDLDRIAAEIIDPGTLRDDAEQFYFNRPVAPSDTWLDARDWNACAIPCPQECGESVCDHRIPIVAPGDAVVCGFDGAQYDDSTALLGCRLSDGHLFVLGIWEKPLGQQGVGWEVDRDLVESVLEDAFERYDVRQLWPDPWGDWRPYVDRWAARWPGRVTEFDTRHKTKMCRALERFAADVKNHSLTHDGNPVLAQHVANARKRVSGDLYTISKDQRKSPRKIDGAVAATLAYAARAETPAAQPRGRVYSFR
jgi:hypothetical protein